MLTLITGGSASGKSAFAERLLSACNASNRIYLATMESHDPECDARIRRHRAARAKRGFLTLERSTGLSAITLPENCAVLLECLTNLAANECYSPSGARGKTYDAILSGIDTLCRQAKEVIVVSGEVFSDGECYDVETLHYIDLIGRLNCAIARRAERVVEVVYSIPVYHKGAKL